MNRPAPVVETCRNGALRIEVRRFADGRYGFDWKREGGERLKVRLHEKGAAVSRARELIATCGAGRLDLLAIDPEEFSEFLKWRYEFRPKLAIPLLVEKFLEVKSRKGLSGRHVYDLRKALGAFSTRFDGDISGLKREDVEAWLESFQNGPRTFNNRLSAIVALIRFARDLGAVSAEKTGVEKIEKRKVVYKLETYTPDEFQKILENVPEKWFPAMVLGGLCGLRPEEVTANPRFPKPVLRWDNILWEKRKVDVPKDVSKDGRRRFVPICDAAMALLSGFRGRRGRIMPEKSDSCSERRYWKLGVEWKSDALRHSYGSYRLALINDIAALSLEMGNSVKMIFDHYLDLKHEDEAQAWFSIHERVRR